jgi:hypothetical protein
MNIHLLELTEGHPRSGGVQMRRALDNPDRDFSASPFSDSEGEELCALLKKDEVADLFDPIVRQRMGELIGRAVFDPAKQRW